MRHRLANIHFQIAQGSAYGGESLIVGSAIGSESTGLKNHTALCGEDG